VGIVVLDLAWALVVAVILAIVSLAFRGPRAAVTAWLRKLIRRVQLRLYLQRREDTQRAIERIAAELTEHRCDQEGNPDEEYRSDWYRWFTGDSDANVDYSRKQQRDLERLGRGAGAAADVLKIERARWLRERRPRLSGRIEKIGHSPDTYQLRVTLDSDEPLAGLDIEMEWTQGFAFQVGDFGIYPSAPREVALRAYAYRSPENEPAGIRPRGSVTWLLAPVGSNLGSVRLEATCYGEDGEQWDRVFIRVRLFWSELSGGGVIA
jgi:hypothetical protein